MAKSTQRIVLRNFQGIDRRDSAPANSFWDLCNLVVKDGVLKSAPGPGFYMGDLISGEDHPIMSLLEYVHDPRFEDSHQDAIIAVGAERIMECTPEWTGASITDKASFAATPARTRGVMHKMVHSSRYATEYMPCLVLTNGIHKPRVYHQYNGTGTVGSLVCSSGNISGVAYLDEAPIAKHCATYKERLFFANVEGAENRVYWTDVDAYGVWTCNVWPAAYNLDVGYGESITNLLVFKGILYIFTNRAIWALSGEGVSGQWALSKLADTGASEDCAVAIGDAIFFGNDSGAYLFAGGQVKRVSDQVAHAWSSGARLASASFLSEYGYVFLTFRSAGDGAANATGHIMIFDTSNGYWYRWGPTDDANVFIMFKRSYDISYFSPGMCLFFDSKTGVLGRRSLFSLSKNSSGSVYVELRGLDTGYPQGTTPYTLLYPWMAVCNHRQAGETIIVRDVTVAGEASKLSNSTAASAPAAKFMAAVLPDDAGFAEGLADSVSTAELCRVASFKASTAFASSCAIPTGTRVVAISEGAPCPFVLGSFTIASVSSALVGGVGIDRIKPTLSSCGFGAVGSFMVAGNGVVLLATASLGKLGIITVSMDSGAVLNLSSSKWSISTLAEPIVFEKRVACNAECRKFRVLLAGLADLPISSYVQSAPGYFDVSIDEISVGVHPLGRLRVPG